MSLNMTLLPTDMATIDPPGVAAPGADSAVVYVEADDLKMIGNKLNALFMQYRSDRRLAEMRWMRNLRQYLGIYDDEIDKAMAPNRSRAYPRLTRVKCVSVLSRLMNLMFQGTERNWTITADYGAGLTKDDVNEAISNLREDAQKNGEQPNMKLENVMVWVKKLMTARAKALSETIDDQFQEIGGDQTLDYVSLNRAVLRSGIIMGLGVLSGPYAIPYKTTKVTIDQTSFAPTVTSMTRYKPQLEFDTVWDVYPDMSAKTLDKMDGYFRRKVMTRSGLRDLAKREDFFGQQIKAYLKTHSAGNYRPMEFETELRALGVKINVNEMKLETLKYEVIIWHGPLSGEFLRMCGVEVADDKLADDIDAEVWLIDGNIIKADINPWRKLDMDVKTLHYFLFDEDDASPVGQGLPNVMRDSQMSISAATRMLLDNASVICGPNLEVNIDLLPDGQDISSTEAYKVWYRTGTGPDAQFPAVRDVKIEGHLDDLMKVIELFMKFADMETFVGPATGGDMAQTPSEPMRTAAGASMMRGDAALPFKDIVRNFDRFTQSVIQSLVQFNKKFNPERAQEAEFNVIARGATSLIAKEVRGMQVDQLAQSLTEEEKEYTDMKELARQRFLTRDLPDMLLPDDVVARNQAQKAQDQQTAQMLGQELQKANTRKLLSDAFKNIAQGNKNSAAADAHTVDTALSLLEQGLTDVGQVAQPPQPGQPAGAAGADQPVVGDPAAQGPAGPDQLQAGPDQGQIDQLPGVGLAQPSGSGQGLA